MKYILVFLKTLVVMLILNITTIEVKGSDFNGDGTFDILVQNTNNGRVNVWLNTEDGASNKYLKTLGTKLDIITIADINGDGKSDVIVQNRDSRRVNAWISTVEQSTNQYLRTLSPSMEIVDVADVNGDGKDDIVVKNNSNGRVNAWISTAGKSSNQYLRTISSNIEIVKVADINGDLKEDIIIRNISNGRVNALISSGGKSTYKYLETLGSNIAIVDTADINGDGKEDILIRNTSNGRVNSLISNEGKSTYKYLKTLGSNIAIVAIGDVNGDGKEDILIKNTSNKRVNALISTVSNSTNQYLKTLSSDLKIVKVGDVDIDGNSDIILQNISNGRITALLNTDEGTTNQYLKTLGDGIVVVKDNTLNNDSILFSEDFSYADGTELDIEYESIWNGRYADRVDATIENSRALLSSWATLGLKEQFKNLRDQWTRVSVDLFDASQISYMMSGAYGITVTFDGKDRINIASGNTGFAPQCAYETIQVVPDTNNSIKVEIYVKDNKAMVHIIDTEGRQSTKLLGFTYGNINHSLGLGYHGAYDNLEIAYLKDEPPVIESKSRAPLFITQTIEEGIINDIYKSETIDETMRDRLFVPVQIYADQGEGVVQYKVTKGFLPIGVILSSEHNMTGNQSSPDRYLARLHGTPTIVGDYYFTVEASDELGQKSSRDFFIKIKDGNATSIFYHDDFNGTDGENATTRQNSIWEAKNVLPIVDEKADTTANQLELNTLLRNDPRQYLHIRTKFYPQKSTSTADTAIWLTGGGAFGISAKYENGKVTVLGDNIGYAPQTNRDEFNVTLEDDKPLIMDVYLKGKQSRVYITDANSTQATILYDNYRLPDEESDYQLYVGGVDTLVDEVLIETTSSLPLFYNELKITSADVREGFEGLSYFDTLNAMSGKAPYSWTATSLPDGLSLSTEGVITGVPSSSGTSLVTFTVTDGLDNSDSVDINLSIKTDDTLSGVLLFADDFDISPSEVTVSVRDAEHYAAHPDYALRYEGNKLLIQPHKQGSLKKSFLNDGTETLKFSWSMNKGKVNILREGTCFGLSIEYDSVQKVKISWGDICYDPLMEQRDFILQSSQEEIHINIELKGQDIVFEVKDSNETYQRGKFTVNRDITNHNMFVGFRDNTPYGVGLYTSYQSGNMYVDNLRIVQGADSLMNPASKLKQQEELGKLLFYDPILSDANNRACVSCHLPGKGFTDGKQGSMGLDGVMLSRNTPSLTSAALMGSFFHDGRASSITEQSLDTIKNPKEMNQDLDALVIELSNINEYENKFNNIWNDGVTTTHVGNALEAYINTLLEMRTKFDQDLYRQGDFMSEEQTAGLILFNGKAQCTLCHILEPINNIGDFVYNTPKFESTGTPSVSDSNEVTSDIGRMAVTGEERDRGVFRVPPLRDLLRTAPYMHNGVFSTLEEVIEFYNDGGGIGRGLVVPNQSEFIFPLDLTVTEKSELVEFLKAMSPDYPANVGIPKTVPSRLPVGGRFGDDEDNDEDGINNLTDNCPMHKNADQVDSDGDGFGDVCEE